MGDEGSVDPLTWHDLSDGLPEVQGTPPIPAMATASSDELLPQLDLSEFSLETLTDQGCAAPIGGEDGAMMRGVAASSMAVQQPEDLALQTQPAARLQHGSDAAQCAAAVDWLHTQDIRDTCVHPFVDAPMGKQPFPAQDKVAAHGPLAASRLQAATEGRLVHGDAHPSGPSMAAEQAARQERGVQPTAVLAQLPEAAAHAAVWSTNGLQANGLPGDGRPGTGLGVQSDALANCIVFDDTDEQVTTDMLRYFQQDFEDDVGDDKGLDV